MKELITIVIPCYNNEKYIEKNIESIINQTYKEIQIIYIDDFSNDNTYKIIEKYKKEDNRIELYRNYTNFGVSKSRNFGISLAKGKYICFLDSDDTINEKFIDILYNNLINNDVDVSICSFNTYKNDKTQNFKSANYNIKASSDFVKYIDDPNAYKGFVWNKMYRLDLVKKVMFNKDIYMNEDLLFNIHIATVATKFYYTPEKLYNYHIRTTGAYNQAINEKKLTSIDAYKQIISIIKLYFKENEDDFQIQFLKILLWLKYSINKETNKNLKGIINKETKKQYDYIKNNIKLNLGKKIEIFIKYRFALLIKLIKKIKMILKG